MLQVMAFGVVDSGNLSCWSSCVFVQTAAESHHILMHDICCMTTGQWEVGIRF
jgi:hypothetical protein